LMLFILNSLIRYTIKFPTIPAFASENPPTIPIINQQHKKLNYTRSSYHMHIYQVIELQY
jgi:hypothetical protein